MENTTDVIAASSPVTTPTTPAVTTAPSPATAPAESRTSTVEAPSGQDKPDKGRFLTTISAFFGKPTAATTQATQSTQTDAQSDSSTSAENVSPVDGTTATADSTTTTAEGEPLPTPEEEEAFIANQPLHLQPRWKQQLEARRKAQAEAESVRAELEAAKAEAQALKAQAEELQRAQAEASQQRAQQETEAQFLAREAQYEAQLQEFDANYLDEQREAIRQSIIGDLELDPDYIVGETEALINRAVSAEMAQVEAALREQRATEKAERQAAFEAQAKAGTIIQQEAHAVGQALQSNPLATVAYNNGDTPVSMATLATSLTSYLASEIVAAGQPVEGIAQQVSSLFNGVLESVAASAVSQKAEEFAKREAALTKAMADFEASKPAFAQQAIADYLAGKTTSIQLLGNVPTGNTPAIGSAPSNADRPILGRATKFFSN